LVVNPYPPPGLDSYRNKIILVVLTHDDTGSFMNDLDVTCSFIIQNGENVVMIHHLIIFFLMVQPSLSIIGRLRIVFNINLLWHNSRTNVSNVS